MKEGLHLIFKPTFEFLLNFIIPLKTCGDNFVEISEIIMNIRIVQLE